jgi:hypothetical protein
MPNMPKTRGRFGKGTVIEIMTRAPEKIPATPIPATALPTIKTVLEGATAQMREPISKMKTAAKKAHLTCIA